MFAFSVLHRLDLLTDSSCDIIGLRKYLSSLRKKLSQEEIFHFTQVLSSLETASTSHQVTENPTKKANSNASPIHESQGSAGRVESPIISPRNESIIQAEILPPEPEQEQHREMDDYDRKVSPVFNKFKRNRKR
jgi:hypothetical protein